jgi:O-antigen/teichoic acid export membrane protein
MVKFWENLSSKIFAVKGLATIGIVDIISNAISGIFWIVFAGYLGAENLGEISYLLAIAGIGSAVALVGSENSLMVYIPKKVQLQGTVFLLAIIMSCITATVLFFIFSEPSVSFLTIGYVLFGLVISEILGKRLYTLYSKYMIIHKILLVCSVVGFYFAFGIQGILFGMALAFTPFLIEVIKVIRNSKIDFSLLKIKFEFMRNMYFLSLSGIAIRTSDKLIIAYIFGYEILGNYHIGLQVVEVLQLLTTILYKYTLPHDASGTENIKLKKISFYLSFVISITAFFLSPILLPIMFPKFSHVIEIVQISSFALVPNALTAIYTSKFLGNEKSNTVVISLIIYFVIQITSIILLGNIFGVNGIASSFVLAAVGQATFLVITDRTQRK